MEPHGAVSSFPTEKPMKHLFLYAEVFPVCLHHSRHSHHSYEISSGIEVFQQSEVDLVTKAAKTRRKNPCGNTTSCVAKKTQSVFFFFFAEGNFHQMWFLESQKSNSSSQLGVFFLTFPFRKVSTFGTSTTPSRSGFGLCLRLTHWEAAETFSDLLMQLPPGRLRCSALLNRAPLGRISWEFRFRGENRGQKDVLVEDGLKFWITLSICECIFENMHITGV